MTEAFSPSRLRRALVIKLRHHGDVLLTAPVLSALKRAAPDCEIDALIYADTAPMLEGHPALSQLHLIDRRWKREGAWRQLASEGRLFSRLNSRDYDLIVHLSINMRGAWLARALRPHWSVAPRRGGRQAQRFWNASFTHFYAAQSSPDRHTVESNLDALRALGIEPSEADKRVVLVSGPAAEASADALLAKYSLAAGNYIHIHAASRWRFKCWPAERVAELCDRLAQRGLPMVLTCAPDDAERRLTAAIVAAARVPLVDLSGALTLKELAALTARAKLFVGVDSAPMHIAAAMSTPVVAIFGPSGEREWGPWLGTSRVVASLKHPCRPCGKDGCDGSKISECLTTLPVEQVFAACEELL